MGLTQHKSPLVEWVTMLASVAILAVPIVVDWKTLFDPSRTKVLIDIDYYRAALGAVAGGLPLFDVLGYPPFALIPLAPLGWLPLRPAEQLWTAVSMIGAILLAAIVVWQARRLLGRTPELPGPVGAITSATLAAFLMVSSYPLFSQFFNGQISLLVVCLTYVDACGLLPKRFQGSLIGIAGAIKLTPMLFVPYYLVTGQRRQAVTSFVSFLVATGIGFALYPSDSVGFWTHLGSTTRFGDLARFDNLSLYGTLFRWVTDPTLATYSWYAMFLIVGGIALLRARTHFVRGEMVQASLIVGTASVAISPVAWPHHQIWLVLVAIWLLWTPQRRDRLLGIGLLVAYSISWNIFYGPEFSPDLLTFIVWEPRALIPVVICLTGLPRNRARNPILGEQPSAAIAAAS